MKSSFMSIVFTLVAGQQVSANNYAHFFTADGVPSVTGHNIDDAGCIRYDYDKQGFTYAQSGMAGNIIKSRCFIKSIDGNCNCQNNGTTFVADETVTFIIEPEYHSLRFVGEGCENLGASNCPKV